MTEPRTYTFWPGPNAATRAELDRLLARGCMVKEIAMRMGRDPKQIQSWLKRFGLKTRRAETRAENAKARALGRAYFEEYMAQIAPSPGV